VGLAVSLIIIAVGAILTFAVTAEGDAVDPQVVGVILMVVGFVAFLLDLLLWSPWGPGYMRRSRTVVDDGYPARRAVRPRRAVVQDEVVEEVAPRRRVVQEEVVDDVPPGPPAPP
jgi:hypothetical protein